MEIKGYYTFKGYMGHVGNGKYQLFPTEMEYLELMAEILVEQHDNR